MDSSAIGRWLIGLGVAIMAMGILFVFGGRFGLGRLTGDVHYNHGQFSIYFPIATSIILSLGLTIVLNLLARRHR